MKLKATCTIIRVEKKKQVTVEAGAKFTCGDEEGQGYLDMKAASLVEEEDAPKAKKPAAPKKPAATKKADPAKSGSGEGDTTSTNADPMG